MRCPLIGMLAFTTGKRGLHLLPCDALSALCFPDHSQCLDFTVQCQLSVCPLEA